MDINLACCHFVTLFRVNLEQHTTQALYGNETTWINIVHTFFGNFCHDVDSKINTTPMEHMGHDACLIVGYHNKVSLINPNGQRFPKWKTLLIMFSNLVQKSLTTCFFRTLKIFSSKKFNNSVFHFGIHRSTDTQKQDFGIINHHWSSQVAFWELVTVAHYTQGPPKQPINYSCGRYRSTQNLPCFQCDASGTLGQKAASAR